MIDPEFTDAAILAGATEFPVGTRWTVSEFHQGPLSGQRWLVRRNGFSHGRDVAYRVDDGTTYLYRAHLSCCSFRLHETDGIAGRDAGHVVPGVVPDFPLGTTWIVAKFFFGPLQGSRVVRQRLDKTDESMAVSPSNIKFFGDDGAHHVYCELSETQYLHQGGIAC